MLTIKKLCKSFGTKKVVDHVNLEVNQGEIAVLLGPSGVGKSTLLRLLNNLETIDSGSIVLDNKELDITQVNKNHTVGMVFQQFNLFDHLSIENNITLALEKVAKKTPTQAKEIATKLLAEYNLSELSNKYPAQLSGGQKQRVALARTLALKPKILCLDEPTSALDPILTTYVAQMISKLAAQGYIILITTHDTTLVQQLNCTIHLMSEGKIIESATSQELAQNPEQFAHIKNFMQ